MRHLKSMLPAALATLFVLGCQNKPAPQVVRLATTTSVQDTGLLNVLVDAFDKTGAYSVRAIAVGSGQAMQLGKTGEADLLLVHSPDDEQQFIKEGFGLDRTTFMHNDFVILGPSADPAKIKGIKKTSVAFKTIAASGAPFVSRADTSGTHKKELQLWAAAGTKPAAKHYVEVGQGMAATVTIANEKNAYCLSDRSTYLALEKSIGLKVLSEGDKALINRYSAILVNPAKFPKVNAAGAKAFFDFLLSKPAKELIEKFGVAKFGRPLFSYDHPVN